MRQGLGFSSISEARASACSVDILPDVRQFAISNGIGEDPIVLERLVRGFDSSRSVPDDADAIVRLRAYIQSAAKGGANARRGCMLANGTAEVAGRFPDLDKISERTFKAMEREIVRCVCQAQSTGAIAADRDARTIGVTLLAVVRGMGTKAQAGTSLASLSLAAQGALGLP